MLAALTGSRRLPSWTLAFVLVAVAVFPNLASAAALVPGTRIGVSGLEKAGAHRSSTLGNPEQQQKARFYYGGNASARRETQRDPIGFLGGQTNLYGYVGNEPVGRRDPLGLTDAGITYDPATKRWIIDAGVSHGDSVGSSLLSSNLNESSEEIETGLYLFSQTVLLGGVTYVNPKLGFTLGTGLSISAFDDVTLNGDPDDPDYWINAGVAGLSALASSLGALASFSSTNPQLALPPGLDGNPCSVTQYGHAMSRHGPGAKNFRNLLGRARGTGTSQGQWLDPLGILEASSTNPALTTPHVVPIAHGRGIVIRSDGTIVPARRAIVIRRAPGQVRTTYPIE